jgi:hypothetical protein
VRYLYASEDVARCQDDIGDDCNPEGVGADQWDWDESTDDGEYSTKITEMIKTAVVGGDKFIFSPPSY